MEGMKPLQTLLDGNSAQAIQMVCQALLHLQGLLLSLCNVPEYLPCSLHGLRVGLHLSRDAQN